MLKGSLALGLGYLIVGLFTHRMVVKEIVPLLMDPYIYEEEGPPKLTWRQQSLSVLSWPYSWSLVLFWIGCLISVTVADIITIKVAEVRKLGHP